MARVRVQPCPGVRAARTRLRTGSRVHRWASYTPPERHIFTPRPQKLNLVISARSRIARAIGEVAPPLVIPMTRWQTFLDDCDRFRTIDQRVETEVAGSIATGQVTSDSFKYPCQED